MGMPKLDGKGLPERAEQVRQKLMRLPLPAPRTGVGHGCPRKSVERGSAT